MTAERRLRELLQDPGWSLSPRPGIEARIRRRSRRQRLTLAGLGVGTAAVVAGVFVPLVILSGNFSPRASHVGHAQVPAATSPATSLTAPAIGAPGFPATIYPPATKPKAVISSVALCPSSLGLQPAGSHSRGSAAAVMGEVGHSFASDLRLSDRALWPVLITGWRPGGTVPFHAVKPSSILYSGPLESYDHKDGPPDLAGTIAAGCGHRVARDSWMIVAGPARSPALQGDMLFVARAGRELLYYGQ
jgi:hypothetical protein